MKYLILTLLFFIGFTQYINSSKRDIDEEYAGLKAEINRKYISYQFGISNNITVYVADGDTTCDVSIINENGYITSTTCKKTSLLKSAFDDMANEMSEKHSVTDDGYKSYHYRLSLQTDSCQTIISSSTISRNNSVDVESKIEELKTFMIQLWISNRKPHIAGEEVR